MYAALHDGAPARLEDRIVGDRPFAAACVDAPQHVR
jgi:hypothetical protein